MKLYKAQYSLNVHKKAPVVVKHFTMFESEHDDELNLRQAAIDKICNEEGIPKAQFKIVGVTPISYSFSTHNIIRY